MSAAEKVRLLVASSVRNRIMVCYALCAVAEGEIHEGDLSRASQTTRAIRSVMAEVALLISDPNTISPGVMRETAELVAELESRILGIEAAIG